MNDFKNRHKKSIEKVKADSLEENRAQISIEEVNRYFREIDEMTNDPPIPLLLINFDEIGFGYCPDKGKRTLLANHYRHFSCQLDKHLIKI